MGHLKMYYFKILISFLYGHLHIHVHTQTTANYDNLNLQKFLSHTGQFHYTRNK